MIRAEGESGAKALEMQLYGIVGWDLVASDVSRALAEAGDIDSIHLRINSQGGDVFEGLAIYNLLSQHKAKVEVTIDGLAASAASFIAMAGDRISMAESAMFMIHNAWGFAVGNANDMTETAALLDKIDGMLARVYAARTRIKQSRLREMMDAETWLTGQEAKDQGFVDTLIPNKEKPPKSAASNSIRLAFRNAPRDRLAEIGYDFADDVLGGARLAAMANGVRPVVAREALAGAVRRVTAWEPSTGAPVLTTPEPDDAFNADGTPRSSALAAEQIRLRVEAGSALTPAERALVASWATAERDRARAENLKHAPAARLDLNTQPRLGDCL